MLIFPNPNSELFSLAARKGPYVFYITNFSVLEAMDEEESDDETLISDIGENKGKSGIWSTLTSLVGTKQLTDADVEPVISKMRDHLIGKNVASEVADKLCQSVASKLEGKVLGKSTLFFFFIQRNKTLAMCVSCRTFLPSQSYIFDRKNILSSPGHSFCVLLEFSKWSYIFAFRHVKASQDKTCLEPILFSKIKIFELHVMSTV